MFAYVKCRCGRTLKGHRSFERSTIRCWDCGARVTVPRYRGPRPNPVRWVRDLGASASVEVFAGIALMGMLVGILCLVPKVGASLAAGALIVAATFYIRRVEGGDEPDLVVDEAGRRRWKRRGWSRRLGAAALAAGFVLPFVLADGSGQTSAGPLPLEGPAWFVVAATLWIGLPLATFLLAGRGEEGRLGPREAGAIAMRRPIAMIATLLLFPVGLALLDALLAGGLYAADWLTVFILDALPVPPESDIRHGILVTDADSSPSVSKAEAVEHYLRSLGRGATLSGALPLSQIHWLEPRIMPFAYSKLTLEAYFLTRLLLCILVVQFLFLILGLQSLLLARFGQPAPDAPDPEDDDEFGGPAAIESTVVAGGQDS